MIAASELRTAELSSSDHASLVETFHCSSWKPWRL